MGEEQKTKGVSFIKKKQQDMLENAMFENRVASTNDCTGYMVTLPENNADADNISDLLNVPASKYRKRSEKK